MTNDVSYIYNDAGCRGFRKNITPKRITNLDNYKVFIYSVSVDVSNKRLYDIGGCVYFGITKIPFKSILLGDGLYRITLQITEALRVSMRLNDGQKGLATT